MPFNNSTNSQQFIPSASIVGVFPTVGWQSHLTDYLPYSSLSISLRATKNSTINLYSYPDNIDAHSKLVFSKTITADTNFFKRFSIEGVFFSVEVTNDEGTEGTRH